MAEINIHSAMNAKVEIKNNKQETIDYAETKLTKELVNQMEKTRKEQEKLENMKINKKSGSCI